MNIDDMNMFGTAAISPCGRYRYQLTRSWDDRKPIVAFVMLNPSMADARTDDPTIRRCIRFADRWGFGEMHVYNLYARIATDPRDLMSCDDLFGPCFDRWSKQAREADRVVVAWGSFGRKGLTAARGRCFVAEYLRGIDLWALATNADGAPRHPLYVRADQPLTPWKCNTTETRKWGKGE